MSPNGTEPAITAETAASAGAMPTPERNSAAASHQNPLAAAANDNPATMSNVRSASDQREMGRFPAAKPPTREPTAAMASSRPALIEPSGNDATTPTSTAENAPRNSAEVTIIRITDGICSTRPSLRVAGGITRPRTAGARMNMSPPATWMPTTTRSAAVVPKPATKIVIATGPITQMISWSAASKLNSMVSFSRGVMRGYSVRTAGMTGGTAAPPMAPSTTSQTSGRVGIRARAMKALTEMTRVVISTEKVP